MAGKLGEYLYLEQFITLSFVALCSELWVNREELC